MLMCEQIPLKCNLCSLVIHIVELSQLSWYYFIRIAHAKQSNLRNTNILKTYTIVFENKRESVRKMGKWFVLRVCSFCRRKKIVQLTDTQWFALLALGDIVICWCGRRGCTLSLPYSPVTSRMHYSLFSLLSPPSNTSCSLYKSNTKYVRKE